MIKLWEKFRKRKAKKQVAPLTDKALNKRVVAFLSGHDFADFIVYLKSTRRIIWTNLLVGVFRGLGFILGVTLVFGIVIWILTKMIALKIPIIDEYAENAKNQLTQYAEETKYKENFIEMETLLQEINTTLQKIEAQNLEIKKAR